MHPLLRRQLKRLKRKNPEGEIPMEDLLEWVSQSYEESDRERRKKERVMNLLSQELIELNQKNQAKNEALISGIMRGVGEGIILINSRYRIMSINQAALNIFGYEQEGQVTYQLSISDLIAPEDQKVLQEVARQLQQLSPQAPLPGQTALEIRGLHKQGHSIPLEISYSEIRVADEQRFIILLRDIRERKNAERALIAARDRAEEASRAKAQFLSVMSHEIRTPLNAVIGIANLMMDEAPRPDQLESLKVLKFSSEHLLSLINDILDFSRIEAEKLTLSDRPFDLSSTMRSLHEMHLPKAQAKGLEMAFHWNEDLPTWVQGDAVRLTQVLTNLLSNALKFTESGRVELKIEKKEATADKVLVTFTVADTGIGIAEEEQGKIFDVFTQAHRQINQQFGGTGLGLAISQRILNLWKSQLQVSSTLGEGSSFAFEVWLPLAAPPEAGIQQTKNAASPSLLAQHLDQARILMVEDNLVNQLICSRFLEKWNCRVDTAENGAEALKQLQKQKYDLILMDVHMPVMNGLETTQILRQSPEYQDLPIIALTASADQQTQDEVFAAGMNDYVYKPFRPEELFEKVAKQLAKKVLSQNKQ
jgi:PAS domain S-box-containing protein